MRALTVKADLASDDLDGLIDRVSTRGAPRILVNNVRLSLEQPGHIYPDDICRGIRTDAWAPLALSRRFAAKAEFGPYSQYIGYAARGLRLRHVSYISAKHLLALYTMMMAMSFAPRSR